MIFEKKEVDKVGAGRKRAFTLIELMVVVGIIAFLLLLAMPRLADSDDRARLKVFEANYRTIASDLTAAHSAGSAKETEVAGVRKKAENYKDRPQGAIYTVSEDGMTYTAKFGDYELKFDLASGMTTSVNAPKGAAY